MVDPGTSEHDEAITALVAKYDQYRETPPVGPAIIVAVDEIREWHAGERSSLRTD